MSRIADPLREFAASAELVPGMSLRRSRDTLLAIADQIDRDHARRMDQAKSDMRKATCSYMSRIIADYKRGRKWQRKEYAIHSGLTNTHGTKERPSGR